MQDERHLISQRPSSTPKKRKTVSEPWATRIKDEGSDFARPAEMRAEKWKWCEHKGLNLGPWPCKDPALPLSYARTGFPTTADRKKPNLTGSPRPPESPTDPEQCHRSHLLKRPDSPIQWDDAITESWTRREAAPARPWAGQAVPRWQLWPADTCTSPAPYPPE